MSPTSYQLLYPATECRIPASCDFPYAPRILARLARYVNRGNGATSVGRVLSRRGLASPFEARRAFLTEGARHAPALRPAAVSMRTKSRAYEATGMAPVCGDACPRAPARRGIDADKEPRIRRDRHGPRLRRRVPLRSGPRGIDADKEPRTRGDRHGPPSAAAHAPALSGWPRYRCGQRAAHTARPAWPPSAATRAPARSGPPRFNPHRYRRTPCAGRFDRRASRTHAPRA